MYEHYNLNMPISKRTSSFHADFVECVLNVGVGRKAVEVGRVGDCDVALTEYFANGFACVPVKQVVGADDDHTLPVVLLEDLQQERRQLAERPQRAR